MFEKFKIPPGADSKPLAGVACSQRMVRDRNERQAGRDSARCMGSPRGGGGRKASIKPCTELKIHRASEQPGGCCGC